MEWKELYPKNKRPVITDLESYLNDESIKLFREFISFLSEKLNLSYISPKYSDSHGWYFQIGHGGMIMIKSVTVSNYGFSVNETEVIDSNILKEILSWAECEYSVNFIAKYKEHSSKMIERQKLRNNLRKQQENSFMASIDDKTDKSRLNVFNWVPRISRSKLQRLYESDAKGMLDSELLDELGYSIYARCIQAKEERELMDTGKIKCHNCNNVLEAHPSGLTTCTCGYHYIYMDYRRSFRTNNMPTGGAAHIFNKFVNKWPLCKADSEKMQLIDWLVHEFHINLLSGAKGRFVGINIIQGTKEQIKDLIYNLAYSSSGFASEEYRKYYESHIK